jgi:hypothetical protein
MANKLQNPITNALNIFILDIVDWYLFGNCCLGFGMSMIHQSAKFILLRYQGQDFLPMFSSPLSTPYPSAES